MRNLCLKILYDGLNKLDWTKIFYYTSVQHLKRRHADAANYSTEKKTTKSTIFDASSKMGNLNRRTAIKQNIDAKNGSFNIKEKILN